MSRPLLSTAEWARHWRECAVDVGGMADNFPGCTPLHGLRILVRIGKLARECERAAERAECALEEALVANET